MPQALSHSAQVRSSAIISRWISSLVFGSFSTVRTITDLARGQCRLPYVGCQRINLKAVRWRRRSPGGPSAVFTARSWQAVRTSSVPRLPIQPLKRWPDPCGQRAAPATCHRPATNWPIVRWQQWRNAAQKSPDARRWYRVELVEKQTRWGAGMLTMWGCDGRGGLHRPTARGARVDRV